MTQKKNTKTLRFAFDMIVEASDETSILSIIHKARKQIEEDGLGHYVNIDNATVIDTDDKRPYKARTVFGRMLISGIEDVRTEIELGEEEDRPMPECEIKEAILEITGENGFDGELCQRSFATQAELNAYFLGQSDMDGWAKSTPGIDYDFIPDDIWDKAEKE